MKVQFKFYGVVEAALDKFPNSKIIETFDDGGFLIETYGYDKGIKMWILSQGDKAQIVSPKTLVQEIKNEIKNMNNLYI